VKSERKGGKIGIFLNGGEEKKAPQRDRPRIDDFAPKTIDGFAS